MSSPESSNAWAPRSRLGLASEREAAARSPPTIVAARAAEGERSREIAQVEDVHREVFARAASPAASVPARQSVS